MRVLWFVNTSFPAMQERMEISDYGQHGWWMTSLSSALTALTDISLGVVWANPCVQRLEKFEENGVVYYCVPTGGAIEEIAKRFRAMPSVLKAWRLLSSIFFHSNKKELDLCLGVIEDFHPDIIHVHGTEHFYGLITELISEPVVISLQGILTEYVKVYWGNLNFARRLQLPIEIWQYWQMLKGAGRERQIFAKNLFFQGRTRWDRDLAERLSPRGVYFANGEIIRNVFYKTEWSPESMKKHNIYTTTTALPYKGTNVLIEALARLRERFPDARLKIGGSIPFNKWGGYLRKKVRKLGLNDCIDFLGFVHGQDIACELRHAHVFVLPSFIENSPNSLAEAQIVGTPCVASAVGGIPSMIDDSGTGLLFPEGDVQALKSSIERLFADDTLAMDLSRNARATAAKRHDLQNIVKKQFSIYKKIISLHRKSDKSIRHSCFTP